MTKTFHVRAVLLDMDGTLVDSTAAVERTWLAWAEPHGLDPARVLEVVHGRQGYESMAILLPDRPHELNIAENAVMLADEAEDVAGVVAVGGAGDLLRDLLPHPHAIVTSADVPLMRARMNAAQLQIPALHITAENVTASKPHPEGFLLGASRLGVDPADCLVFEDSEAGIAAAKAAGMRVVGVGAASAAHEPDLVVADLTGIVIEADATGLTLMIG
ncbi:HAD family hydrolase [Microbacterium bovistercoris]|uniref:HAD family hydrolase n=1 Tax=Microbacterium bovistercoris TaxID=2293570 RepID=A0A371NXX5_9MICO|nr:HAD-IA family hydrolase [Microbacterium bovistercoris]REJ08244.1 HAD family hydrolase [Microbacterium bovistercoris]